MQETLIPIRMFKPLMTDIKPVECNGGGKKAWALKGDELAQKFAALGSDYSSLEPARADHFAKEKPLAPFLFLATMREGERQKNGTVSDYTCKTKRKEIVKLFNVRQKKGEPCNAGVIGLNRAGQLIVQVGSDRQARAIADNLKGSQAHAAGATCLAKISAFVPDVKDMGDESVTSFKVKPVRFKDPEVMKRIMQAALALSGNIEGAVCKYVDSLGYFAVDGRKAALAIADEFEREGILLSAEPMPYAVLDEVPESVPPQTVLPIPRDPTVSYPRLGVLDSGVAPIPQLTDWIVPAKDRQFIPEDIEPLHGTCVASVAAYGDRLEGADWTGVRDGLEIVDVPVLPKQGASEKELGDYLERALRENHKLSKVWNLSVSVNRPARDDEFSDFAKLIDGLQREHKIFICKSAGNTKFFADRSYADHISVGAESALALTVGSAAHRKVGCDIADPGAPSPFSCKGPGPEFIVKPEMLHYGGNVGIDANGHIVEDGVCALTPNGEVRAFCGTSFSAPRVGAIAAHVAHELGDGADPLLIKTLLIHKARFAGPQLIPPPEVVKSVGFGIPPTAREILHDDPHSATFYLRTTIYKKRRIEILGFPMPSELIRDGVFTGRITVTAVAEPVLDDTQGREYCQSELAVKFGTYTNERYVKMPGRKKRKEEVAEEDKNNLLLTRVGGGNNLLKRSSFNDETKRDRANCNYERTQIEEGKFAPVKKYDFDLAKCKSQKKRLASNLKWFLEVSANYREETEKVYRRAGKEPHQEICVAITVRDTQGKAPVNEAMARLMNERLPNNNPVKLRSEARVRVRG